MEISNRTYPQHFQAHLIAINKGGEESISRAIRGHFKKEVNTNLDLLESIYPKTIVTLRLQKGESEANLVAKNTANGQKIEEIITGENESGNAFIKILSRIIRQNNNPEYQTFWNGVK